MRNIRQPLECQSYKYKFKLKLFEKLCKNNIFFITPMRKNIKYKILKSKELVYAQT